MRCDKENASADSSGVSMTVGTAAQMPPCEAATMSKAILSWKTAFLVKDISVFSQERFRWLSSKTYWANSARASTCVIKASRPREGKKTAAKWLCIYVYHVECVSAGLATARQRDPRRDGAVPSLPSAKHLTQPGGTSPCTFP